MRTQIVPTLAILLGMLSSAAFAQDLTIPSDDEQIDLSPLLGDGAAPEPSAVPEDPATASSNDTQANLPLYQRSENPVSEMPAGDIFTEFYPMVSQSGPKLQRLSGEYAELSLTVTVPPDAQKIERFAVTYRNSINILSENSHIIVLRDGMEIATFAPEAPGDFETIDLPFDALQPGDNKIVLRAEQSHRIFCGPEASFAIWTDIDPTKSGITVTQGKVTADIAEFQRAAKSQLATGGKLPIVTTLPIDAALSRDLERRIVGLSGDPSARIVVESPYSVDSDIKAHARISIVPHADVPTDAVLPDVVSDADGRIILVLSDATTSAVLDTLLPPPGTVDGPPLVKPGTPISLSELTGINLKMRSRYARRNIPFRLPDDWLLLSSQKAEMNLLYRYTGGLPEGSLLLVKVNETTVRLLPLFGEGDMPLPPLAVGFPARLLQPGMNAISFEALIPGDPPELPCPRIEGWFLEISGDTTLTVPPSPHMQFPSLSQSLLSLAPDQISSVPALRGDDLVEDVVTSLVIGLPVINAQAAQPLTSKLTVSTLATLDQVPLAALGIDMLSLERVLAPSRVGDPIPPNQPATDFGAATPNGPSFKERASETLNSRWSWLRRLAWPGDPDFSDWVSAREGVALLFMPDATQPGDLWLVAGPNADSETLTRSLSEGRLAPDGPDGQAALLTDGGIWQNWQPASTRPQLMERLTIRNARAVAGNYASWAPILFVGILGFLMSMSVVLGLIFVVNTRGVGKR